MVLQNFTCLNAYVRTPRELCTISVKKSPYSMGDEASSHHIKCSIELAEPVLFQKGFNLGCQSGADQEQGAILRGKLILRIAKAVKLKAIRLDFTGKSRTERYHGITYLLPMNTSTLLNR